jgi:hypothetical protein
MRRGGPAISLGPVDDAFSQALESLVPKIPTVPVFAWVAGDEQHRWRSVPVVRSEADPEPPMTEPDIDDSPVPSPALPLRRMALAGLNEVHDFRRKRDRQRLESFRFFASGLGAAELGHVRLPRSNDDAIQTPW